MTWAEKFLHRKFAHKRVDGEWFLLDSKEVAFIKSLQGLEPGYPHLDVEVLPAQP
jgi:hypothetical protein